MDLPVLHQLGIAVGIAALAGVANAVQIRSTALDPGMTTKVAEVGILFLLPG